LHAIQLNIINGGKILEGIVELEIIKRKLSSFRGEGGRVRKVSDELLLEVLSAWEQWTGTASSFYNGIGCSSKGIASILKKAKRLKREGHSAPFQEVQIAGITNTDIPTPLICDIEVQDNNKIIRFRKVDLLVEYLKKAA
jgi:hypothetical protein